MNLIVKSTSFTLKASFAFLGLLGITTLLADPVAAQTANASGSFVLVRPSGGSQSISGEISLPAGFYFQGPLNVKPTVTAGKTPGGNDESISNLLVDPGAVTAVTNSVSANPFLQEAAAALKAATTANDVAAQSAIIKSGAGVNGLSGLE
ncbi:hypothetical protein WA1_37980 [Scytonema hofmannii PCC 7110]|uniref:Uncharacterized protein n=1 Tax=Scytonema hofmannii PCC 7110 TaxID=128403 RepID=A0A139X0B3_9CYAN|nr:hypothetical protein [Scytonema hofmannii]KYC38141.1 hypothetical protein WA1_37980 [Scytonema hofmannii PCC 7110]